MFERRRWGRRAAVVAAVVLGVLALPAAARAFTVVGTQTGGFWWSKDSTVEFDPGETWTVLDYNQTTKLTGTGGSLALGGLHEGVWNIETGPAAAPTQLMTLGLDFTPPTSGDLVCRIGLSGWCISGFEIYPLPNDPQAPGVDHVSGLDHSEYSVDDGPWTTFDPASYTAVDGVHTIRWRAVDTAGNVEAFHTADVKMDTVPPTVDTGLSGPLGTNGWYTGPVTVTLSPSDAPPGSGGIDSLTYDVFDFGGQILSPTGPYAGPFVISSEGREFVQGRVEDDSGEASGFTQEVDIDSTPPSASLVLLSSPPDPGFAPSWYKDLVEVRLDAQDVLPPSNHLPSGIDHASISWPSVIGPRTFSNVRPGSLVDITGATGPTTVTYGATDIAGNTSPPQTQVFDIDSTPPQTSYTYSGATLDRATGWWIGGPVTVTAVGTDPNESGVLSVHACDDRFSFCQDWFGSSYQYVPVENAIAHLTATSTDKVGHVETSSNPITVRDDASPPTGTLAVTGTPGDNGWYRSPVTVTIRNANDVGSGLAADPFHYQIFGSTPTSFDGTYTETNEGYTAFAAEISDAAGNVTRLPQDIEIDTRPPNATIQGFDSQGAGGWDRYAEVDGISGNDPYPGSGVAKTTFSFDGGGPYTSLDQIPAYDFGDGDLPIPDGTHTLAWQMADNAGNVTAGSKTYTVDSTPPDLTCTATTPTAWPTDGSMVPVSVDVSVSDALSGPSAAGATLDSVSSNVDWDAQAAGEASGWDTGTGDVTGEVAALPGRTYSLGYEAHDVAGNQGFCEVQVTVPGAPGPAIMKGGLTLPDGTPLTVDVLRDGTGLIGGAGVAYGGRQSTGIDDVEILGRNGYIHGTLDDGAGFTLLLHDGNPSPDSVRLLADDGIDTGWVVPATGDLLVGQDTTPPVLTLPAGVTADATSPAGATVPYVVTAKDNFDPSPSVSCTPASGTLFPIGDTTVGCTATDASDNQSTGSFTVHVEGAREQMNDLLTMVEQQTIGPGTSLEAKLRGAATCENLRALGNEVRAQTGKKITRQDAATIAGDLARIENVLGC